MTNKNDLETMLIALEEFSNEAGFVSNTGNFISKKMVSLAVVIKNGFKQLFTINFAPMEDLNPIATKLYLDRGIDYSEHLNLALAKPVGLKGELLPYTTTLLERGVILNSIVDKVLANTNRFVNDCINMESMWQDRRFTINNRLDLDLKDLIKEESKLFENNRQGDGLLKHIYNSFEDYRVCADNLIKLRAKIEDGRLEHVKSRTMDLNNSLGVLLELLNEAGADKVSKDFRKVLSEEIAYVAKWIEWYGIQLTHIIEVNNCIHSHEREFRKL